MLGGNTLRVLIRHRSAEICVPESRDEPRRSRVNAYLDERSAVPSPFDEVGFESRDADEMLVSSIL